MAAKVSLTTTPTDPVLGTGARLPQAEVPAVARSQATDAAARPDLRLIIEETGEEGRYVYTLVDRRTGRVVSRLPREQVLKLKDRPDYSAGTVFDGQA